MLAPPLESENLEEPKVKVYNPNRGKTIKRVIVVVLVLAFVAWILHSRFTSNDEWSLLDTCEQACTVGSEGGGEGWMDIDQDCVDTCMDAYLDQYQRYQDDFSP